MTFAGFDGNEVKAWLHVPSGATGPLPTVVQYQGYRSAGFPQQDTRWAQAGWAHFIMDTRGQGWSAGGFDSTADASVHAGIAHAPGVMTAGITDPNTYYYRRVYTDAVRLLEAAAASPFVDPAAILVTGASQGGGLTLAAAGLASLVGIDLIGAAADVPFLCHFRRATELTDKTPYVEITEYLAAWRDHEEAAYRTLGYFDGVNLARRASAPALFSVGLMDEVCPPSTVFAAFNYYGEVAGGVAKDINIYTHNGHEGGAGYQVRPSWTGSPSGSREVVASRLRGMEYRQLGRSGLRVSTITLGTMGFGGTGWAAPVGQIDVDGARRQIGLARDAGVNLFDTADVYSGGTVRGDPRPGPRLRPRRRADRHQGPDADGRWPE